jgi:hypothetical protein
MTSCASTGHFRRTTGTAGRPDDGAASGTSQIQRLVIARELLMPRD